MSTRPSTALPYVLIDTSGPASLAFTECTIDPTRLHRTEVAGLSLTASLETADRIRCAVSEIGAGYPRGHVVVMVRQGSADGLPVGYDLPAALALLAAFDVIPPPTAAPIIGAADLDHKGNLRPIRGAVSIARLAATVPESIFILAPSTQIPPEYITPNLRTARTLSEIVEAIRSPEGASALPALAPTPRRKSDPVDPTPVDADVFNAALAAIRNGDPVLLLARSPGSGKMLLTRQIAAALPAADLNIRTETDTLYATTLINLPDGNPYRAPHSSTPREGLVGRIRGPGMGIGECNLAHGGLLVLDDAPDFEGAALGAVALAFKMGETVQTNLRRTPARFALVMTATVPEEFTPEERERYLARVSRHFPTLVTIAML